jgi:hypothetical protein
MKKGLKYTIVALGLAGVSYLSFYTWKRFLESKWDNSNVSLEEADSIIKNIK